jgi:hypothetical protein
VQKKESRRSRLLDVFARAKRPLRFAELIAAYARRFPEDVGGHEALSSALGALLHSGEVTRVGRGRGVVRYRVALRLPRPRAASRRLPRIVWEIVDRVYQETGEPVSTGDIRRRLKERGAWPDRFPRLVAVLDAMAVDPTDAAISRVTARSTAALRRAPAKPSRGRTPSFWVPAWAPPQCAVVAPTAADALRHAIGAASREAGMPVSQRELRWWIAAQPMESWWRWKLSPARTGAALRNVALRDGARDGEPDALHLVAGPLTCHGGAPKRYTLGPVADAAIRACHITDAVTTLELDVELETRIALRQLGLPAAVRRRLERARETAVRTALSAYCGTLSARAFERACRRRAKAMGAIASWQEAAMRAGPVSLTLRTERRQERERWRAAREIVHQLGEHETTAPTSRGVAGTLDIVGHAALLSPARAKQYVWRMKMAGEIAAPRPELVYSAARRFPRPHDSTHDAARAARLVSGDELALLDAVDVWCRVERQTATDRSASTLMTVSARIAIILGPVLRDPVFIHALRGRADIAGEARQQLAILGELLHGRLPCETRGGAPVKAFGSRQTGGDEGPAIRAR